MQILTTQREGCAGGARPDAIDATIAELADTLARLQWIRDYERAEVAHWGQL